MHKSDRAKAEAFRVAVIARLRSAGRASDADRLGQPGPAGYPGDDEMPFIAAELGGQVVLRHVDSGTRVLGFPTGPPC